MSEAYSAISATTNLGGAKVGIKNPVLGTVSLLHTGLTDLFKTQHPRKTWAFLSDLLDVSERVAKHRLSNARSYTIEELQVMLQSENGLDVLNVLMAGAEPRWWWWAKRVMAIAARRRAAAEIDQEILTLETSPMADARSRRRLKEDQHASQNVGTRLARAETALGFLAPVKDRPVAGPVVHTAKQAPRRASVR